MLLFSDHIEIENIVINHLPSSKKRSATLGRDIDRLWDEEVAEMTAKGRKIWNAELYRLENFQCINASLILDLSTIEVKEIHASHRISSERDLGDDYRPNNIFVASFIETTDQKFIFGRTNTNTLNAGRIDLIGGALSKTERPVVTGDDLFRSALSEIEEELNIPPSDVGSGYLCAILKTPRSYVGLVFHIRLNVDLLQFESRFRDRDNDEITEAVAVDERALDIFLGSQASYLPSLKTLPFIKAISG